MENTYDNARQFLHGYVCNAKDLGLDNRVAISRIMVEYANKLNKPCVSESALDWWELKSYDEKSSLLYMNGFSSNSHSTVKNHHIMEIYVNEHSR